MIKFENDFLNVGKGFDWKNQWFVAPYSGIYFISLSGTKDHVNSEPVIIHALLNGKEIVEVVSIEEMSYDPFSIQHPRKLKAKDRIELFLRNGVFKNLHFTGWLVEEQFDF